VLNATYVFRYGYDGERLVMLRVSTAVNNATPDVLDGSNRCVTASAADRGEGAVQAAFCA
jgi:hypothetical protein